MNLSTVIGCLSAVGLAIFGAGEVAAETVTLRNVHVVSPEQGSVSGLSRVVFQDDRILSVEPESPAPVEGRQIDGDGGYVTPGLWDMHIHVLGDPTVATVRALPQLLSFGITGVRDMGSVVPGIVETRRRLAADQTLPRPRLYVSGPLLDGQALPWYGDLPLVLKTPEEVGPALASLKAQGMDFFKVYGGLSPEVLQAVGEEARRLDMPVAGHITLTGGMAAAARIGQRGFEHLSIATLVECLPGEPEFFDRWVGSRFQQGYDAYWDISLDFAARADWATCEARFRDLAEAGSAFTPTLVMEFLDRERTSAEALALLPADQKAWCERNLDMVDAADRTRRDRYYAFLRQTFDRMRAADLRVVAGSDASNFCLAPGESLLSELDRLVELGLTPAEAVAAATTEAARLMDRSDDLGRISRGYRADILLTRDNPLNSVRALRALDLVVAAGRLYDQAALAAMRRGGIEVLAHEDAAAETAAASSGT